MANPRLAVCVVGMAVNDGRVSVVAAVNDTAVSRGVTARDLLNAAMPSVDGRGGGKDELAQGGGTSPEGVEDARWRRWRNCLRSRVRMTGDVRSVGVRIGIDVGTVRVGVARSDPSGTLAVPVATIDRRARRRGGAAPDRRRWSASTTALEVLVGHPCRCRATAGPAASSRRGVRRRRWPTRLPRHPGAADR